MSCAGHDASKAGKYEGKDTEYDTTRVTEHVFPVSPLDTMHCAGLWLTHVPPLSRLIASEGRAPAACTGSKTACAQGAHSQVTADTPCQAAPALAHHQRSTVYKLPGKRPTRLTGNSDMLPPATRCGQLPSLWLDVPVAPAFARHMACRRVKGEHLLC